jgi:hypothetical protein
VDVLIVLAAVEHDCGGLDRTAELVSDLSLRYDISINRVLQSVSEGQEGEEAFLLRRRVSRRQLSQQIHQLPGHLRRLPVLEVGAVAVGAVPEALEGTGHLRTLQRVEVPPKAPRLQLCARQNGLGLCHPSLPWTKRQTKSVSGRPETSADSSPSAP